MGTVGSGGKVGSAAGWGTARWFRAYTAYGKAPQVIDDVARFVRREDLTESVISLRVERGADKEFLLFLTLQTEQWGELTEALEDALPTCRHLRSPVGTAYSLEEIETMASGDLQIKALGQCLEYRRVVRETHEDPFEIEARVLARDAELPAGAGERLLWCLSAAGNGSWAALRAACQALGVADAGLASRLARHLRLLGHLDITSDGSWTVAPPAVVTVSGPDGSVQPFLVGARDSRLQAGDRREGQPGGPDRVLVGEPEGRPTLLDPAYQLAEALPDTAGFLSTLGTVGSVNERALQLKHFDGQRFEACTSLDAAGLYELTSPDGRIIHALRDGALWRRGEFFALRFLALGQMGLLGSWRYDAQAHELALRHEERPPELYERALVLCSGLLPEHRGGWLVYRAVPLAVAQSLANRLELGLETL
ncbi:hypothetical protein E7T06_05360 [Deinococcus sp. Arct2-2]|uniref:hypothetical protein n=1 Tax=Deinococcus sp. Arct2-2 TaxID=2568653 RepID=UPI0010A3D0D3|nr:hypothetical protein [Deinococcus sp. Arct2-2]THF70983.1 hypothetical protein E7T06_05360 [Deinococcus sp. Arct2-2]